MPIETVTTMGLMAFGSRCRKRMRVVETADGAGALDVLRLLEVEDLPAHQPRHPYPPEAHESDGYDHVINHT